MSAAGAIRAGMRAALVALLLGAPALAQSTAPAPATLIADRVELRENRVLVASGNVEVFHDGQRLRAAGVEYDRVGDRLTITGPIVLTGAAGELVVADSADLSADLRSGILRGARLVLERQLQIASSEIAREEERYTRLSHAVASSCQVCAATETPLWEIRARRIVHDREERQIYFDRAQFRFAGVPVFYLPQLRMPDPTLRRATGFLQPRLISTSTLGTGVHVPYFIVLGRSRDLTLTPFVASKDVQSLGLRYRQAFRRGTLTFEGAISHDRLRSGGRGFAALQGAFDLGGGFNLALSAEVVSDRAYLLDYGMSNKDRLDSRVVLSRVRARDMIAARLIHFHSIREGERNATLPALVGDVIYQRRFVLPGLGGIAALGVHTHGHYRSSDFDGDDGRDVLRSTFRAEWRRDWLLPMGILAAVGGEAAVDLHRIWQDGRWPGHVTTFTPTATVELRWPVARSGRTASGAGVRDVIEPVVQIVQTGRSRGAGGVLPGRVPNEDSVLLEFDEGNLFSTSRFPGADRREAGARMNVGLGWTRLVDTGWTMGALVGRVLRSRDLGQFTAGSGLTGRQSDWLGALHLGVPDGIALQGRALWNDDFDLTRSEVRLDYARDRYGMTAAWVWAVPAPAEDRPAKTSELALDGRYRVTDGWTALASGRYDFAADRATAAAVGLEFANECLRVDLSLSRRFTSSTTVVPTTNFGLAVDLIGFGSGRAASPAGQRCRR